MDDRDRDDREQPHRAEPQGDFDRNNNPGRSGGQGNAPDESDPGGPTAKAPRASHRAGPRGIAGAWASTPVGSSWARLRRKGGMVRKKTRTSVEPAGE